jgi:3-deoxy-7-phosphoheptulonate synthase
VGKHLSLPLTQQNWTPTSWRSWPALQQPAYPSLEELESVRAELALFPPLVTSWEIAALKAQLGEAALGQRFLMQGGDCAERFADCQAPYITRMLKVLLQMSLVLLQGCQKPVIRMGRFAGQYAKPRSDDFETRGNVRLPSYRGDLINLPEFTLEARTPDPRLLLRGYSRSAMTLNFIRSLVKGGFADLHHPEYWKLDFIENSPLAGEYHRIISSISESLQFTENVLGVRAGDTDRIDFYTSHEALHLEYESAQTRLVPHRPGWFNLTTHFPWIGVRTAAPGGAHIEYCRGIENPIGIKIGPNSLDSIEQLIDILHPTNEPGRLTLIHRFGANRIAEALPRLIEAVRRTGKTVLFVCDPMHGNTRVTASGIKTRTFDDIRFELDQAFEIHRACGSYLGGVHVEVTGESVTECTGGALGLSEADLDQAYHSEVDPRLNPEQALEIALLVARRMSTHR